MEVDKFLEEDLMVIGYVYLDFLYFCWKLFYKEIVLNYFLIIKYYSIKVDFIKLEYYYVV